MDLAGELTEILKDGLPNVIRAQVGNRSWDLDTACEELGRGLALCVQAYVEGRIRDLVHVHDYEYDDEGGLECACGARR